MRYHFWDMDHTIINNDCDVSWKEYLIRTGRVDGSQQKLVDDFFDDYSRGELDPVAFMAFQLSEFRDQPVEAVREITQAHFDDLVKSTIYPGAVKLIRQQLEAGDFVSLLTATNNEIARPLQTYLGIPQMLATDLEIVDGKFTGELDGIYCCKEGKLAKLMRSCSELGIGLGDVFYYGDSISDLPVLRAVGHPIATNPVSEVRELARESGWKILDFQ